MLIFGGKINPDSPCFIIAEIGQNHQGSIEIAKEMIVTAKEIGVDCVKFQKSCLSEKFTRSALERPYMSENSWGQSYGEHKQFLEFSIEDYKILQDFSRKIGILFTASAMDLISFKQLENLKVPFIKIGSGDADNIEMLNYAAKSNIPLVVSTGMQSMQNVRKIVSILEGKEFALLQCVSSYPTRPQDVNLRMIEIFKQNFPNIAIGYSGHEEGIQISVASVLLGAKVIERHFTLDKSWKGSDHKASLTPLEFREMIKLVRKAENCKFSRNVEENLENLMPDYDAESLRKALKIVSASDKKLLDCEKTCHDKLGKSLVFSKSFRKNYILQEGDVTVKVSEPAGLSPQLYAKMLGKQLVKNVEKDDLVLESIFIQ